MEPEFLYFDLGNVVLHFSHQRAADQMAAVAGIPSEKAWRILFDGDGLEWSYERGELTREQFLTGFCEKAGRWPDRNKLDQAGNDIFELNVPIVGLLGSLSAAAYRLGILSNTSPSHWQHCTSRFGILRTLFPVHALSFRLRAMKPEARAFAAAAELAGVPPARVFYTDDRADNVTAARVAGFDAVVFHSVSQLNQQLLGRGVAVNY
jgi:FMN phosphatase YigB (HAD superfamily)